ncbi:MAG: ABC transporter ATP-binding protein [Deltaproteobacteria bacterium]|nr:ABC transporter ATP-binding protein [Deltaproteobacteria bacterium]
MDTGPERNSGSPGGPGNGFLLKVQDLCTWFYTLEGVVRAVDGVSFDLRPGETLGLVGESGCGKTITALSILRLFPSPPGKIVRGEIRFEGADLARLPEGRIREIRGGAISMIFQEPMTSLNPTLTVGYQIAEAILAHQHLPRRAAAKKAVEMVSLVGISSPDKRVHDYPHQLSGGMRQRAMIAMALACRPKLLIADEPTTALDVTIQAQILDLMMNLKRELGTAIILITHNLGVIAETAQRVGVMYAGKLVEMAPSLNLFREPLHPYTQGLLHSIPWIDREVDKNSQALKEISGTVPSLIDPPPGCRFHPRCPEALALCREGEPIWESRKPGHWVRCWRK